MTAFEGLIPDNHDGRVQDLIFTFAHCHSLAKLKLHTDDTLAILDEWTVILGTQSCLFVTKTCDVYETCKLKWEYQARKRNEDRKKGKATNSKAIKAATGVSGAVDSGTRSQPSGSMTSLANEASVLNAGTPSAPSRGKRGKGQKATSGTTARKGMRSQNRSAALPTDVPAKASEAGVLTSPVAAGVSTATPAANISTRGAYTRHPSALSTGLTRRFTCHCMTEPSSEKPLDTLGSSAAIGSEVNLGGCSTTFKQKPNY